MTILENFSRIDAQHLGTIETFFSDLARSTSGLKTALDIATKSEIVQVDTPFFFHQDFSWIAQVDLALIDVDSFSEISTRAQQDACNTTSDPRD